jgi:hypothetical protein
MKCLEAGSQSALLARRWRQTIQLVHSIECSYINNPMTHNGGRRRWMQPRLVLLQRRMPTE